MKSNFCNDCDDLQKVNYGTSFYCNRFSQLLFYIVDDIMGIIYRALICPECAIEREKKNEKDDRIHTV